MRDAIAAIPVPPPTIAATGSANGTVLIAWSSVPGVGGYELLRRSTHGGAWTTVSNSASSPFTDGGLSAGHTYVYRARAYDGLGNRSVDSNYEVATTITFTDEVLVPAVTTVRATHIVELRVAVNSLCSYAGAAICAAPPFTGSAIDENYMKTQNVTSGDFLAVKDRIVSLRLSVGASPATFHEAPAPGVMIKGSHLDDLRAAVK